MCGWRKRRHVLYSSPQWPGTRSCPRTALAGRSSPPSSLYGPDAESNEEALERGGHMINDLFLQFIFKQDCTHTVFCL